MSEDEKKAEEIAEGVSTDNFSPEELAKRNEEQKAFMERATKLVLHIPTWVHPQHEIFYRLAYLQVKEDEKASNNPARVRTLIIRKLMNRMITQMGKFYTDEQKKKEAESGVEMKEQVVLKDKEQGNVNRRF